MIGVPRTVHRSMRSANSIIGLNVRINMVLQTTGYDILDRAGISVPEMAIQARVVQSCEGTAEVLNAP